jgi:hypothetical protein
VESFHHQLTRSIHRSYAVKSGEGIVNSEARGGSESAHRGTGKNSWYSEVLVRTLCSWVVSFLLQGVNSLHVFCTIPPLGIVNRKSMGRLGKKQIPRSDASVRRCLPKQRPGILDSSP